MSGRLSPRAARRWSALVLACLIATALAACTGSPASSKKPHPTGQATASAARIAQLTQALRKLRTLPFEVPGDSDIVDYQIGQLWRRGIDGAGTTVAVIEGWNYPGIAARVHAFDRAYDLPDPQIRTVYPVGLPSTCPPGMVRLGSYGSCSAWAGELTLDVDSVHLIAPYARILIVVAPADTEITDDAASQVAPPEMMKAVEYVAQRHLANVISISDGTGESSYSHGPPEIIAQVPGELAAAAAGIPLLVGTGDCGVVQNLPVANGQCEDTTTFPDTAAWDDSPWVTAVGGTVPDIGSTGQRLAADQLWMAGRFGSAAGYSKVFTRPAYQDRVNHNPMRSVPDLVMDARLGTSEATPLLAGVLALATQLNGANVGPINPALYGVLGPRGAKAGIVDVTSGNDSVTLPDGKHVRGFTAGPGFDVASGWGTINAAVFVPSLVAATKADRDEATARQQAAAGLSRLEHGIMISGGVLRAGGFLPGHPVRLAVDGKPVTTLTASGDGTVRYRLQLSQGQHQITLSSMLLIQSTTASGG
jgi:subtilase family serine protease